MSSWFAVLNYFKFYFFFFFNDSMFCLKTFFLKPFKLEPEKGFLKY